jgi:hypothetical protein
MRVRNLLFAAMFVMALSIVTYAISGAITVRTAGEFVASAKMISANRSQISTALQMKQRFRSHIAHESQICSQDDCSLEFRFENPIWRHLHWSRRPWLVGSLNIEKREVSNMMVTFGVGGGEEPSSVVNIIDSRDNGGSPFRLYMTWKEEYPSIHVGLSDATREPDRRDSFDLRLECLALPWGCSNARALAPHLTSLASGTRKSGPDGT